MLHSRFILFAFLSIGCVWSVENQSPLSSAEPLTPDERELLALSDELNAHRSPAAQGSALSREVEAEHACEEKDRLVRVVNAHMSELVSCYEMLPPSERKGGGDATLRWTIATDGTVDNAGVISSSLQSAQVIECALAVIRRWRFGPHEHGHDVEYPFTFSAPIE